MGVTFAVLRKSETSNCPKETIKAKIDPAETPEEMLGSVIRKNAVNGPAPRLRAACSSEMS